MSLLASFAGVMAVGISALLFTSLGFLLLDAMKAVFEGIEKLLVSLAVGVAAFECLVSIGSLYPATRMGIRTAVLIAGLLALIRSADVAASFRSAFAKISELSPVERWLIYAMALVIFIEAFAAMAPLTGSDALHYHFASPALTLKDGFHPNWFLQHSFLTGLSHQLILAGLAVSSEKLAMGWIFLGGAVSAVGAAYLARKWVNGPFAYLAGLLFLLTPVTFWQITNSGAPDIWMAFFLLAGVVATEHAVRNPSLASALPAGIAAGAIAGAKYTGIMLAGILFIAFLTELRRLWMSLVFFLSAAVTGCFPYLRNWWWTGDPLFPFLIRRLHPESVNFAALTDLLHDTGATSHLGPGKLAQFVFFAWIDPSNPGFWQILGPIVLCFLPLIFLAFRWSSLWRIALIVWLGGALGIGISSGLTRFTLPLLPIALAACMAGVSQSTVRRWRAAEFLAKAIIAAYLCIGLVGLMAYDKNNLAVAAGLTSREDYLRSRAPDYQRSEFVNQRLAGKEDQGRALVFFSHTYYITVPYRFGLPSGSWAVDPSRLKTDSDWKTFFQKNNIRWLIREESFPPVLSESLGRLEKDGGLADCGSGEVHDLIGNRIGGKVQTEHLTLLCVRD